MRNYKAISFKEYSGMCLTKYINDSEIMVCNKNDLYCCASFCPGWKKLNSDKKVVKK